jgi:hypothetical protein
VRTIAGVRDDPAVALAWGTEVAVETAAGVGVEPAREPAEGRLTAVAIAFGATDTLA